jgi:hypothetical protein
VDREVETTRLGTPHAFLVVMSADPTTQPPLPGPIPTEPSPDPAPSHTPSGPVPFDPVPVPQDPTEPQV